MRFVKGMKIYLSAVVGLVLSWCKVRRGQGAGVATILPPGWAPKLLPTCLGTADPRVQDVPLDLLHEKQGRLRAAGIHSWTTSAVSTTVFQSLAQHLALWIH